MRPRYYVCTLRSLRDPAKTYVGFTENLDRRLAEHNSGSQVYSHRYAPWALVTFVAFSDRPTTLRFERYLKTPSGKAFIQKHLIGEPPLAPV
ncbi:GIY-YIG nuclease family protein [bacterium]|nr:GIY-YIG nuclease family protein [bacterium]